MRPSTAGVAGLSQGRSLGWSKARGLSATVSGASTVRPRRSPNLFVPIRQDPVACRGFRFGGLRDLKGRRLDTWHANEVQVVGKTSRIDALSRQRCKDGFLA
jgi:hypothetical protein